MKHLNSILIAASLAVFTACGTTKNIAGTDSTTTVAPPASKQGQDIASSHASWNTMQCSGTIRLGGSKSLSSSVSVRMERDKSISISVRPMLGIEVGRLVFKGDSVLVVDKLHKQYIAENVSMFTNGLPATVSTLQDIFMGRSFILGEGTYTKSNADHAQLTADNGKLTLAPSKQVQGFTYSFTYDTSARIQALQVIPDGAKSTTYSVNYDEVKKTVAGNVAHSVSIDGTIKGNAFNISLDYNDITWNQAVKIDSSIPSGYSKADIRSLTNILGGN